MNIINCTFENNTANKRGGAVYSTGNTYIENTLFANNNVTNAYNVGEGGAVWLNTKSTITNCTFNDNYAYKYGGAVYATGANTIIGKSIFKNNSVEYNDTFKCGGAIHITGQNDVIENCTFIDNLAYSHGGAVYSSGRNLKVNNCNFTNNTARRIGSSPFIPDNGGSGMFIYGAYSNVTNCIFDNNNAWVYSIGTSGSLGIGDGANNVIVDNCNFTNNTAYWCGAIVWLGSNGILNNSNFIDNSIKSTSYCEGGAVFFFNPKFHS